METHENHLGASAVPISSVPLTSVPMSSSIPSLPTMSPGIPLGPPRLISLSPSTHGDYPVRLISNTPTQRNVVFEWSSTDSKHEVGRASSVGREASEKLGSESPHRSRTPQHKPTTPKTHSPSTNSTLRLPSVQTSVQTCTSSPDGTPSVLTTQCPERNALFKMLTDQLEAVHEEFRNGLLETKEYHRKVADLMVQLHTCHPSQSASVLSPHLNHQYSQMIQMGGDSANRMMIPGTPLQLSPRLSPSYVTQVNSPYLGHSAAYVGQSPAYLGQSSPYLGQSPPYLGQSPPYLGQSPPYLGQSPAYVGQSTAYVGQSSAYLGQSPAYLGQNGASTTTTTTTTSKKAPSKSRVVQCSMTTAAALTSLAPSNILLVLKLLMREQKERVEGELAPLLFALLDDAGHTIESQLNLPEDSPSLSPALLRILQSTTAASTAALHLGRLANTVHKTVKRSNISGLKSKHNRLRLLAAEAASRKWKGSEVLSFVASLLQSMETEVSAKDRMTIVQALVEKLIKHYDCKTFCEVFAMVFPGSEEDSDALMEVLHRKSDVKTITFSGERCNSCQERCIGFRYRCVDCHANTLSAISTKSSDSSGAVQNICCSSCFATLVTSSKNNQDVSRPFVCNSSHRFICEIPSTILSPNGKHSLRRVAFAPAQGWISSAPTSLLSVGDMKHQSHASSNAADSSPNQMMGHHVSAVMQEAAMQPGNTEVLPNGAVQTTTTAESETLTHVDQVTVLDPLDLQNTMNVQVLISEQIGTDSQKVPKREIVKTYRFGDSIDEYQTFSVGARCTDNAEVEFVTAGTLAQNADDETRNQTMGDISPSDRNDVDISRTFASRTIPESLVRQVSCDPSFSHRAAESPQHSDVSPSNRQTNRAASQMSDSRAVNDPSSPMSVHGEDSVRSNNTGRSAGRSSNTGRSINTLSPTSASNRLSEFSKQTQVQHVDSQLSGVSLLKMETTEETIEAKSPMKRKLSTEERISTEEGVEVGPNLITKEMDSSSESLDEMANEADKLSEESLSDVESSLSSAVQLATSQHASSDSDMEDKPQFLVTPALQPGLSFSDTESEPGVFSPRQRDAESCGKSDGGDSCHDLSEDLLDSMGSFVGKTITDNELASPLTRPTIPSATSPPKSQLVTNQMNSSKLSRDAWRSNSSTDRFDKREQSVSDRLSSDRSFTDQRAAAGFATTRQMKSGLFGGVSASQPGQSIGKDSFKTEQPRIARSNTSTPSARADAAGFAASLPGRRSRALNNVGGGMRF